MKRMRSCAEESEGGGMPGGGSSHLIRRFTAGDAIAVGNIYKRVLEEYKIKSKQADRIVSEIPGIHQIYGEERRAGFWCLELGTEVVGSVALVPWSRVSKVHEHQIEEMDGICEIKRLYLLEQFRGRGLGRLLLKFAEEQARDMGYTAAWLDSPKRFKLARRLYLNAGYAEEGTKSVVVYTKSLEKASEGAGEGWL